MRENLLRIIGIFVVLIGILVLGTTTTKAQTSTVDGEWNASMNTPGGVREFKIVFKVEGEKLTGTVKRSAGDVPLAGKIKDNDIEFNYTVKYNGNDLTISMTGKVDGNSIKGTVFFGESGQQDEWGAKRAESKPSSK